MEQRINKIYIDASVIAGYFDDELELKTRLFFDEVKRGRFQIIYSSLTHNELLGAPQKVRDLIKELPKEFVTKVKLSEEVVALADNYIFEKRVGQSCREDRLHFAIATVRHVDVLLSWDFKNIVNYTRFRAYNSINMELGYPVIDIRSPKEIML
jgi:hypothetical protein